MTRALTRAVEESVLVKMGMRAADVHVMIMTVLVRVVTRVDEMMVLENLKRVEDDNASVIGGCVVVAREGGEGGGEVGSNSSLEG